MTKREKIARAMWERNRERCAAQGVIMDSWEDENEALHADWLAFADAALDELAEPSEFMVEGGKLTERTHREARERGYFIAPDIWGTMIDRAKFGEPA